jgi:hypothetical protein
MKTPRVAFTSTLLNDGRVLIAGGWQLFVNAPALVGEVFDPVTNTFANVGAMLATRRAHGAARLASGRIVLAGGDDNFGGSLYTIDVFDPATGQFARGNDMAVARQGPVAIGLPDGRVFVAGGFGPSAGAYQSGEIVDPGSADAWLNRLPLELDLPSMKSRTPILRWNPLVSAWSTSGPSCSSPPSSPAIAFFSTPDTSRRGDVANTPPR